MVVPIREITVFRKFYYVSESLVAATCCESSRDSYKLEYVAI